MKLHKVRTPIRLILHEGILGDKTDRQSVWLQRVCLTNKNNQKVV
jgi:hypothetical protein